MGWCGAQLFLCVCLISFSQFAVASVGRQPFTAIPRCSGPCGLPGPLRVASLIPGVSTAGPLRVFCSRGPGGVGYIRVLNCEGLSDHNVYLAGSSCVAITSCVPISSCVAISSCVVISSCVAISVAGFTLTNRNTYIW